MKPATHASEELDLAKAAIDSMKSANDFSSFEDAWKEFLRRLERTWNKCVAHYKRSPKWNGWKGLFEKHRRKDPLLSYLINARGAEEHAIEPITKRESGGIGIGAGPNGIVHIKRLELRGDGSLFLDADDQVRITFYPGRVRLLEIENRGRKYEPPASHLGKPVNHENVLEVAQLGAAFYETLLSRAEHHFTSEHSI